MMGHFPPVSAFVFSPKKVFIYYGFLGDNNFGDELVFESAKKIFEPDVLVPVRKLMPITLKLYCILFKSKISGIVIGGGTLIGPFWNHNIFLELVKIKKPVYIHGTGVYPDINCKDDWKKMLGGHVYGGVRGPLSQKNSMAITNQIKITGDAAFAMFEKNISNQSQYKKKHVLLNLGTHFDYEYQDDSRAEIKKLIHNLIQEKYNLVFLPFHDIDKKIGESLILEFPEMVLLSQPYSYKNAMDIFQNSIFSIGERLHFTAMSILSGCPFVSINYSNKHEDMLQSIGLSLFGVQPGGFYFQDLKNRFINRFEIDWKSIEFSLNNFKELQISEKNSFLSEL